jgi:hypothetical protein
MHQIILKVVNVKMVGIHIKKNVDNVFYLVKHVQMNLIVF